MTLPARAIRPSSSGFRGFRGRLLHRRAAPKAERSGIHGPAPGQAGPARKMLVALCIASSTVAVLFLGLYAAYTYAVGHPLLRIDRIDVAGNEVLREEEIVAMAGVRKESPILSVDLAAVEARLIDNPRVKHAEVRRHLPRSLEIVIEERTPSLLVRVGGKVLGLDADGVSFPLSSSAEEVSRPILIPGEAITARVGTPLPATTVAAALEVSESLRPDLEARVSEIRSEEDGGILLLLADGTRVRLGKSTFAERVGRLRKVLEELEARGEKKEWIDLRFARTVTRP